MIFFPPRATTKGDRKAPSSQGLPIIPPSWKGARPVRSGLPTGGHATPMTYRLPNGKQYVVIAAGGHAKIEQEKLDDSLVAFALP